MHTKQPASLLLSLILMAHQATAAFEVAEASIRLGEREARIQLLDANDPRTYRIETNAELRDNRPADKQIDIVERFDSSYTRSGVFSFDALYAMAVQEAHQNSVDTIRDAAYADNRPIRVKAYQTGEKWHYVWTRDLAYALQLGLAAFDPHRALESLRFKASALKHGIAGEHRFQIVQDTGSGGSYPVSSDRVVWAIGAHETLKYLSPVAQHAVMREFYAYFRDSIEQDRRLVYDPKDGLYRGEQSFLDWREQTYPLWTSENVLPVAMSKALSVNVAKVFLLRQASAYAATLGKSEESRRYAEWADDLSVAVNRRFFDSEVGLYRTYLFSEDGADYLPVARYDLLGNSLAVLLDVADEEQAAHVVANYPTGPMGPPVLTPQVPSVPIYHNQGIWPFVTAYGLLAAHKTGNAAVIDAHAESLMRLTAVNLSNMENYDFLTGSAHVKEGERQGPTINSRRQLWSVAGYLALVEQVIFGQEANLDGIRFRPSITASMRSDTLADSEQIELHNFAYRGTRHTVQVSLPEAAAFREGIAQVGEVRLNGREVGTDFVPLAELEADNLWEIRLRPPARPADSMGRVNRINIAQHRMVYGPVQPQWDEAAGAVVTENGRLRLRYQHPEAHDVQFRIYRNGQLVADEVRGTRWTDPDSADYQKVRYRYAVVAQYAESGHVSHPTQSRSLTSTYPNILIPAERFSFQGGDLHEGHVRNWGRPNHRASVETVEVEEDGLYHLRVEFSNGSGPVNTGISCAVKRVEIRSVDGGDSVAAGYLIMAQSGDWMRWDLSNVIEAPLRASQSYMIEIYEDDFSRNMSYLESNRNYTAWPGGGADPYNYVNLKSIRLELASEEVR